MACPLRREHLGALYHAINRGHRKEKIFRRIADGEVFLEKLIAARRKTFICSSGGRGDADEHL